MLCRTLVLFTLCCSAAWAAPTLNAPSAAAIGSQVEVTVVGSTNPRDFVTIVPADSREGAYEAYQYVKKPGGLELQAPPKPGDYEIRLLGAASPYPTLARKPLKVETVDASLDAPDRVQAGAAFQVKWSGPNNARDYVGIGDIEPKKRAYISYIYTNRGNPITLNAPDEPGEYELRYFLAAGNEVIARKRIVVASVSAALQVPAQVAAGSTFDVAWQGPDNPRDFVTIVAAGTPKSRYGPYVYTAKGSPLQLRAPDKAGEYEVRYLTAQTYATLVAAKISVTAITASLAGPTEVTAGESFPVKWQGPDNLRDYITIVAKEAREGESGHYAYTARGNPITITAPLAAGDYELRYSTGQSHTTLARQSIRVKAGEQAPGMVRVTAKPGTQSAAVEIILDASGSMLQRIGPQRRIDIAKQTLTRLTSSVIPSGTPFALRVFGREVDSCQTDLEVSLGPLDAVAVGRKIASLEAKNNARTPIGASLEKVADDLKDVRGERVVIVLTDGEETCGGDPGAAIHDLRAAGIDARVNIVGFAIDDAKLAATFRHWSDLGGGTYFSANDAAGLNDAMSRALRPAFEVVNANGETIGAGQLDGEAILVPAGNFGVRLKGSDARPTAIVVKPKETTALQL